MGLGVVFHPHRQVLGLEPLQRPTSLSSSRLCLGLDRDGQQRVGKHPRLDDDRPVLGRDRVPGLGVAQLATLPRRHPRAAPVDRWRRRACEIARRRARPRRGRRARARPPPLNWLECPLTCTCRRRAASRRRPGPPRAGRRRGRWWSGRPRRRAARRGRRPRPAGRRRSACMPSGSGAAAGVGKACSITLEQLLDAGSGRRGDRDDREEGAVATAPAGRRRGVGADLLAAEVAVEQRLVLGLLDDRLDEGPRSSMSGRLVAVGSRSTRDRRLGR